MLAAPTRTLALLAVSALAAVPLASAARPPAPVRADAFALGAPKGLDAAVKAIEQATGVRSAELTLSGAPGAPGRSFQVDAHVAERLLAGSHSSFRKAGVYLFRYERSYGIAGDKDHLGLMATRDRDAVIRRVGTSSPDGKVTPDALIAWLNALEKDEPFELAEVGIDYVAGTFLRSPKDPAAVARRCVEIAPDLVGGRQTSVELLSAEIRDNRTLYLIW